MPKGEKNSDYAWHESPQQGPGSQVSPYMRGINKFRKNRRMRELKEQIAETQDTVRRNKTYGKNPAPPTPQGRKDFKKDAANYKRKLEERQSKRDELERNRKRRERIGDK